MAGKKYAGVKLTLEEARREVESLGMEPLFDFYGGIKRNIKVRCTCGKETVSTLERLRRGSKCRDCGYKNRKERTIPYREVSNYYRSQGCVLLVSEEDYVRSSDYMDFLCRCGNIGRTNFYSFRKLGVRCSKCAAERISGDRHYNYNPDLTEEDRERMRYGSRLREWSRKVKERDGFTCVFCEDSKGGNLHSHHLDGYSNHPEKRYDVTNGVTLCTECHKDFHDYYGYGDNTREQFEEFTSHYKVVWSA